MTTVSTRQPRQDRSRATRQRLLDAAIECLAELGWSGTTVLIVAERAGVSRGAAQHHFPTRETLVTGTIEHMAEVRAAEIGQVLPLSPAGSLGTQKILEVLFGFYSGPVFRAALQLWVAAAADESLRGQVAPLEAELGRQAHRMAVELLGVSDSEPAVRTMVQATLDLVRGLGLASLLSDDSARRAKVLRQWAKTLDGALPRRK